RAARHPRTRLDTSPRARAARRPSPPAPRDLARCVRRPPPLAASQESAAPPRALGLPRVAALLVPAQPRRPGHLPDAPVGQAEVDGDVSVGLTRANAGDDRLVPRPASGRVVAVPRRLPEALRRARLAAV